MLSRAKKVNIRDMHAIRIAVFTITLSTLTYWTPKFEAFISDPEPVSAGCGLWPDSTGLAVQDARTDAWTHTRTAQKHYASEYITWDASITKESKPKVTLTQKIMNTTQNRQTDRQTGRQAGIGTVELPSTLTLLGESLNTKSPI